MINRGFPPCMGPRYALRSMDLADVCDELALMLVDTLTRELSEVGPEDVLTNDQLEGLQQALAEQVYSSRAQAGLYANKADI